MSVLLTTHGDAEALGAPRSTMLRWKVKDELQPWPSPWGPQPLLCCEDFMAERSQSLWFGSSQGSELASGAYPAGITAGLLELVISYEQ